MKLKVVAISSNTNSFGLYRINLISDTGEGYAALANSLNKPGPGAEIDVGDAPVLDMLIGCNWECPKRLKPDPPPALVKEVWGKPVIKATTLAQYRQEFVRLRLAEIEREVEDGVDLTTIFTRLLNQIAGEIKSKYILKGAIESLTRSEADQGAPTS